MKKILVTGATGQIGSELTVALRDRYGAENVIAAGYKTPPDEAFISSGPYCSMDVRDASAIEAIVDQYDIDTIFHLAALLSAIAEEKPQLAWDINMNGLLNILEIARSKNMAVFSPSSIGAFGPTTPANDTPQDTIQRPNTMYGVTKVSGELLCDYYHSRYGVDTRGLRFPGLISWKTMPGGGTTDYAVEIFYAAIKHQHYDCFLQADTRLDMMYMSDAIHAAISLMEADSSKLIHRNAFNVTAISFTPQELADEIKKIIPDFTISYVIDPVRQAIAESWPRHMDDSAAREEWDWKPECDLNTMVKEMLHKLENKLRS